MLLRGHNFFSLLVVSLLAVTSVHGEHHLAGRQAAPLRRSRDLRARQFDGGFTSLIPAPTFELPQPPPVPTSDPESSSTTSSDESVPTSSTSPPPEEPTDTEPTGGEPTDPEPTGEPTGEPTDPEPTDPVPTDGEPTGEPTAGESESASTTSESSSEPEPTDPPTDPTEGPQDPISSLISQITDGVGGLPSQLSSVLDPPPEETDDGPVPGPSDTTDGPSDPSVTPGPEESESATESQSASESDTSPGLPGLPSISLPWPPVPSDEPTSEPTSEPTQEPTSDDTGGPTSEPTSEPTQEPTGEDSDGPDGPTSEPTSEPTQEPTGEDSDGPDGPTSEPTSEPTQEPTGEDSDGPDGPTSEPTSEPTAEPTSDDDSFPTGAPEDSSSSSASSSDTSSHWSIDDQWTFLTDSSLAVGETTTPTQAPSLSDADQPTFTPSPVTTIDVNQPPQLPRDLPKIIFPSEKQVETEEDVVGMSAVTILFDQGLNWPWVATRDVSAGQIFAWMPVVIANALQVSTAQVKGYALKPYVPSTYHSVQDANDLGTTYITYIPSNRVNDLAAMIRVKQSEFYTLTGDIGGQLAARVVPSFAIDTNESPLKEGAGKGSPSGAENSGNSSSNSRQDAIIGVVSALGGIALLVLIFLVYRAWQRKREMAHRRMSDPPAGMYDGSRPEGRAFDQDSIGGNRRRSFYFAEDSLRGQEPQQQAYSAYNDEYSYTSQGGMTQRRVGQPISSPMLRENTMNW